MSIVLGIAALGTAVFDRTGDTAHKIARLWCRLLCEWNGIRVDISGLDNILHDRPQIFVANHQSYFDIFALSGYLPVQLRWVAKSSLFRIPFIGWSMKAAGYVNVNREDRKKAYQAFLETIEKIKSGYSVVVFPEGTRSEDETVGPFKKGSHLLAVRSHVPMVPVTIVGSGKIIRKGSAIIRPGPVRLVISPPLTLGTSSDKKGEEALNAIRDTICETHARLTKGERKAEA